jgi:wobble nucleotide-excising tRNase
MLKKIVSIRNIGKFADYQCKGDVELRQLNIIYADNGRGKTTLAAILRSLKLGEGSLIEGRQTLGASNEPRAELLLDGSTVTFEDGSWDAELTDLELFDEAFIAENVYSGSRVGHDHKRNLHHFVIGVQGVELAQKVDLLDEANRTKAREIREQENKIERHIVGSIAVSDFVDLQPPPEGAIAEKEKEIAALENAERIAEKSVLKRISLPAIPLTEIEELLAASVESVSREAAQRVQEHLKQCMDDRGESWLESGLDYLEDNTCPFCGQSLVGNDLVEAYQAYFAEAYQDFKEEIVEFSEHIHQLLLEDKILDLRGEIASNDELGEFWQSQVDAQYPDLEFETVIQQPWQDLRDHLEGILEQKATAPLEELEPDEALENAIEVYRSRSQAAVDDYNQTLARANELIESKKEETKAGDLVQAREELEKLKNQRARHKPEVDRLCREYEELCNKKEDLEKKKERAKPVFDTSMRRWPDPCNDCALGVYLANLLDAST